MRGMVILATTAALVLAASPAAAASDEDRDLHCLALNVYHEARNQPLEGQLAVAHVTLNRLDDPSFPSTICDVVFRSRHFSWTNDLSKRSEPPREAAAWETAQRVARIAMADRDGDPVQGSTYFHLVGIRPDWAASFQRIRQIGDHIFYARVEVRSPRRMAQKQDEQRAEVVTD